MTDDAIIKQVDELIHENMLKSKGDDGKPNFHYTKPSIETYPYQFFWDTCFHVFILVALGRHEMAKEHLISLFAKQEDNGFVGHMIYWDRLKPGRVTDIFQSKPSLKFFWKSHMSALIQPPMAAMAVESIYKVSQDKQFLKKMLPQLKLYYNWLAENRDFDNDYLLTIISPFESGMDWKPTYDQVLGLSQRKGDWRLFLKGVGVDFRNYINNYDLDKIQHKSYFRVKDVGFNSIYSQNLDSLSQLCKEVNDPDGEGFKTLAQKVTKSILKIMYDKQDYAFYDVYGTQNKKLKVLTPTIFYPIMLEDVPKDITEKVINRHFFDGKEFDTPYPIPSLSKNNAAFNPYASKYIWRGPTWIVNNWFIHKCLKEKGYTKEAEELVNSIKNLVKKSGFREYYNPFTGEGYGAKRFTWAGLLVDMMYKENKHTN